MGAIIFGGNFMVRGATFRGGNFPLGQLSGGHLIVTLEKYLS